MAQTQSRRTHDARLYHFTDGARLPWIIAPGELRVSIVGRKIFNARQSDLLVLEDRCRMRKSLYFAAVIQSSRLQVASEVFHYCKRQATALTEIQQP